MGSWDWDLRTGEQVWDEGQYRIFGTEPARFAPTVEAMLAMLHPNDREPLRRLTAEAAETAAPTTSSSASSARAASCAGASSARRQRWMPRAAAMRISGVTYDITERRRPRWRCAESEERLRIAQETSGIGIWDWDLAADRIIWIGDVYRMWGLDQRRRESSSVTFSRVVHPEDQQRVGTRSGCAPGREAL